MVGRSEARGATVETGTGGKEREAERQARELVKGEIKGAGKESVY